MKTIKAKNAQEIVLRLPDEVLEQLRRNKSEYVFHWRCNDSNLLELHPSNDGRSCIVVPNRLVGTAIVCVENDHDEFYSQVEIEISHPNSENFECEASVSDRAVYKWKP